jgi:hypothetical protein
MTLAPLEGWRPGRSAQHPHTSFTLRGFRAGEARRAAERFEWHYTPKNGSWRASSLD